MIKKVAGSGGDSARANWARGWTTSITAVKMTRSSKVIVQHGDSPLPNWASWLGSHLRDPESAGVAWLLVRYGDCGFILMQLIDAGR